MPQEVTTYWEFEYEIGKYEFIKLEDDDFETQEEWIAGRRAEIAEELSNIETIFPNLELWDNFRIAFEISDFPEKQRQLDKYGMYATSQHLFCQLSVVIFNQRSFERDTQSPICKNSLQDKSSRSWSIVG